MSEIWHRLALCVCGDAVECLSDVFISGIGLTLWSWSNSSRSYCFKWEWHAKLKVAGYILYPSKSRFSVIEALLHPIRCWHSQWATRCRGIRRLWTRGRRWKRTKSGSDSRHSSLITSKSCISDSLRSGAKLAADTCSQHSPWHLRNMRAYSHFILFWPSNQSASYNWPHNVLFLSPEKQRLTKLPATGSIAPRRTSQSPQKSPQKKTADALDGKLLNAFNKP